MTSLSKTVSRLVPAGARESGAARLTIAAWLTQIIHGGMNPKSSKRAGLRRLLIPDSIVYAANQQIWQGWRYQDRETSTATRLGSVQASATWFDEGETGPAFGQASFRRDIEMKPNPVSCSGWD